MAHRDFDRGECDPARCNEIATGSQIMQAKLVAGLFIILAILASYAATYKYGRHVEFITQDNLRKTAVIKQQEENQRITLAYAKKLTEGMVQYEKDQVVIAAARDRIRRLQINFPACPVPSTTGSPSNPDEANRVLSDRMGVLFAELQTRTSGLIEQCDQINAQAIMVNSIP